MREKVDKKLLLGIVTPYLLIVLIVCAAQCLSGKFMLNTFEENVVDVIESSLKSDVAVIEKNIESAKEKAAIVAQNTATKFVKVKKGEKNYYSHLIETQEELLSYYTDGIIKDICIQYDDIDCLINFDTAFSSRLNFYKNIVTSPDKSPEELLAASEKANGFSVDNICYYSGTTRTIPFVYPIPILRSRTGSVSIYIDEDSLLMPISNLLETSMGTLKIINNSGEIISLKSDSDSENELASINTNSEKISFKGKNYYVFKERGHSSNWEYLAFLPENYVLSKMHYYQTLFSVFNLLILILAFCICFLVTTRKSRSFVELLRLLEIEPETHNVRKLILTDEYKGLKHNISQIKSENNLFLENGRQNVLRRVLSGQLNKTEEIVQELRDHKIELTGSLFGVIYIHYPDDILPNNLKRTSTGLLFEKVRKFIPNAYVYFIDKSSATILFAYEGENFEQFAKECVIEIEKELFAKNHITALIGIGEPVTSLDDISTSYNHAHEVVEYRLLLDNKDVYFYHSLPTEDDYYYPVEVEELLVKSVLESNFEAARDILKQIQEENFVKRTLSVAAINGLLAEIRVCIKKICRLRTEYLEFSQEECSVNHFFENAISLIYMICSEKEYEGKAQPRGQKICQEVKNYIELYYSEPNLSLDTIADAFSVHPNYISKLFKKETGINLKSFLENTRIEKATELLKSGKYTVNEISVSVGFSNDDTFRRRFKKIKGVPPSAFFELP